MIGLLPSNSLLTVFVVVSFLGNTVMTSATCQVILLLVVLVIFAIVTGLVTMGIVHTNTNIQLKHALSNLCTILHTSTVTCGGSVEQFRIACHFR